MDSVTLKPCPFCGGEAEMFSRQCAEDAMEAWIQCSQCFSVTGSTEQFEDAFAPKDQAIAAWNTRSDDAVKELVEQIKADRDTFRDCDILDDPIGAAAQLEAAMRNCDALLAKHGDEG